MDSRARVRFGGRRRVVPLAAACFALLAVAAPPALAGPVQRPGIEQLWSEYPLEQPRGGPTVPGPRSAGATTEKAQPAKQRRPPGKTQRAQNPRSRDTGSSIALAPVAYTVLTLLVLLPVVLLASGRAVPVRRALRARARQARRLRTQPARLRRVPAVSAARNWRGIAGRIGELGHIRLELAIWVAAALASVGLAYVIVVFLSSGRPA